jgi:hypothetical protein
METQNVNDTSTWSMITGVIGQIGGTYTDIKKNQALDAKSDKLMKYLFILGAGFLVMKVLK